MERSIEEIIGDNEEISEHTEDTEDTEEEPSEEPVVSAAIQRPKKERTQKQKDALEKARETRTRNIAAKKAQKSEPLHGSLVGGPKVIFEISSIGPRIPFSRPKMFPENAWWPHFCEETAPCGRKSACSPTAMSAIG